MWVPPVPPHNLFCERGRCFVCCSQEAFLRPDVAKSLLAKKDRVVCLAGPMDPPESHTHHDRAGGICFDGLNQAEIALLYIKWQMRYAVCYATFYAPDGDTELRSHALQTVFELMADREWPAKGFVEGLLAKYSLASINFSMDTAIAVCQKTERLFPHIGPAAHLDYRKCACEPRPLMPRPNKPR
jgi:hypothetical protein